jgi:hypothetical protein
MNVLKREGKSKVRQMLQKPEFMAISVVFERPVIVLKPTPTS